MSGWNKEQTQRHFFSTQSFSFLRFSCSRFIFKRILLRWSDCTVIVNIYKSKSVGTWYGYANKANGQNEMPDSRETAIDCLPLDSIQKLYQFDVMLRQSMHITATISGRTLLIFIWFTDTELGFYMENYSVQLFYLLPTCIFVHVFFLHVYINLFLLNCIIYVNKLCIISKY